jgi:hypothetical protein
MTLSCGVQNDSAAADVTETAAHVTDAAAAPAAYRGLGSVSVLRGLVMLPT